MQHLRRGSRSSITTPNSSSSGYSTTRRRSSLSLLQQQQQQQQKHLVDQQQDSLSAISESGKPTLVLATYASDEFLAAMRTTAGEKFTVVPSRQLPPHMRRMSEPTAVPGVGALRTARRHSVDAIIDGAPVASLSKRSLLGGSGDSSTGGGGQLTSFAELDELDAFRNEATTELERAAAAALTARELLRYPGRPPASGTNAVGSQPQQDLVCSRRVRYSFDSAVTASVR